MGWIIAAAIVLFFVLLLAGRVSVYFDHNGQLALKIKYMCFTIIKLPKKNKKPPKKADKKVKADKDKEDGRGKEDKKKEGSNKDEKEKDNKKKNAKKKSKKKAFDLKSLTFDDVIDLLKLAFSGAGRPLKKLFKSIEVSHLSVGIVCGGDDAAKTAIKFGAVNIVVGNALGLLDSFFTLKPLDDMNITVDFQSEETLYDLYFEVRLTLFAAVAAGFRLLRAFIKIVKSYKQKQAKNEQIRAKTELSQTK